MPIVPLYGHATLRARLSDAAARGTLPSSILLAGPRGVGKQRLALWLGQLLLCTAPDRERPCGRCQSCRYATEAAHPDLHWIYPRPRPKGGDADPDDVREDFADATSERVKANGLYVPTSGTEGIFVATVRAVVHSAALSPALARRKVFVVGEAERMVPQGDAAEAANAFLKLLEEPPADTTIILTSSEPGALLPTIRSRVVTVRVAPLADDDLRAFLADPMVRERIATDHAGVSTDALVRTAGGAPGRLLGSDEWSAAMDRARLMLEAARRRDRGAMARVALVQGATGARGKFSDVLDALTVLLHDQARSSAEGRDEPGALGAARAIDAVEEAKGLASGNVNPQLVTASLVTTLARCLA